MLQFILLYLGLDVVFQTLVRLDIVIDETSQPLFEWYIEDAHTDVVFSIGNTDEGCDDITFKVLSSKLIFF